MDIDVMSVQKLVDTALDKPRYTYPMFKNAQRPANDYAGVRLLTTLNPGTDKAEVVANKDGTHSYKTTGIRVLVFEVMFSRGDEEADRFNNAFQRPDVLELMRKSGYALMSRRSLDVKTLALETEWEVRAAIEVVVNTIRTQTSTIEVIDGLEISGDVIDADKTTQMKLSIKKETS